MYIEIMRPSLSICIIAILLMLPSGLWSQSPSPPVVKLHAFDFDDGHHQYYFDLLRRSLEETGYKLELIRHSNVPQRRIQYILDNDWQPYFHIFLHTGERDERWKSIPFGLTESLIAHRVLFIPKGQQPVYDEVRTLEDFRNLNLVGAFGAHWYDIDVWKANDLAYMAKEGDWRVIYSMLEAGDRGIDYFSRGVTEILGEWELAPELEIEKRLLFLYDRDFRLYMTDKAYELFGAILEEALIYAGESGLIQELIREHWEEDFRRLGIDDRIVIRLQSPGK